MRSAKPHLREDSMGEIRVKVVLTNSADEMWQDQRSQQA